MVVGNKLFSYPVVNNDITKSTYLPDISFDFSYSEIDGEYDYVLKDIHYTTNSSLLQKLCDEGKTRVICVVECSETVYRKSFEIPNKDGFEFVIKKADIVGKVVVSAYAVATENVVINSKEFIDDYRDIDYEIEKYNILAVHDGYAFYATKDEKEDNIVRSIFSVIPDEKLTVEDGYDMGFNGRRIVISLNADSFSKYKFIYKTEKLKEVFFGMLLVHALETGIMLAIRTLESGEYDVEDICNRYRWFKSVVNAYQLKEGKELTKEVLLEKYKDERSSLLAQKLLGNPINKSLSNLFDDIKPNGGVDDESY